MSRYFLEGQKSQLGDLVCNSKKVATQHHCQLILSWKSKYVFLNIWCEDCIPFRITFQINFTLPTPGLVQPILLLHRPGGLRVSRKTLQPGIEHWSSDVKLNYYKIYLSLKFNLNVLPPRCEIHFQGSSLATGKGTTYIYVIVIVNTTTYIYL